MENQHPPPNLWVSEAFVDRERDIRFGETDPYESFTADPGRLFKSCQREYGRCTGKVYIDTKNGKAMAIGWVFLGKDKYQDCNRSYLREVWITLHDGPPTRTTQIHYHEIL
jgi:hypothetical protein